MTTTIVNLTVFVLAIFVGYHVVWNVTPALHTPLMSVTNAISSVIIVGAILASGSGETRRRVALGTIAVALAAVNTFGGFLVSQRMLEMFKKKEPEHQPPATHHQPTTDDRQPGRALVPAGERPLHPLAAGTFSSALRAARQPASA